MTEEVQEARNEIRKNATIADVIEYFKTRPCYDAVDNLDQAIAQYLRLWGQAKSVFEFGCGCGRTLNFMRVRRPDITYFGIDSNESVIKEGIHKYNLDLMAADHTFLDDMRAESYDFVFTLSVIDHIPPNKVREITNRLKSIAKQLFVAFEIMDSDNAYTWIHDYESLGFRKGPTHLKKGRIPYTMWLWQREQKPIVQDFAP